MSLRNFMSDKLVIPLLMRSSQCAPWPWYEELCRFDKADRIELYERQWENFRTFMEYAEKNVSYYEESFSRAGVRSNELTTWNDLLSVPTINKQQISAHFPDRITSRESDRNRWQYVATSGTTDRLMVVKDTESGSRGEALNFYADHIRGTYMPGSVKVSIPPDACSLACAASVQRSLGAIGRMRERFKTLTARGIGGIPRSFVGMLLRRIAYPSYEMPSFGPEGTRVPREMLQWYSDNIRNYYPKLISGLPEYLLLLARYIEKNDKPHRFLKSLLPEGSLSTPSLKIKLSEVFNVPVHEVYGGHEFGSIASTCEQNNKMHIMMTSCLVETIRKGEHVPFGELGEIIVTSYTNKAMPLIRYRPGDVGRIYDEYCACGRQSLLLSIEGRLQDTIVTSKGIFTSQQIIEFFTTFSNIAFFQLVQRNEKRCDLLIVENEPGGTNLRDLSEAVEDFLGEEIQVRPRLVSTIKPEVSGKFRFVKSSSFNNFHDFSCYQTPSSKKIVLNRLSL